MRKEDEWREKEEEGKGKKRHNKKGNREKGE
jgi:hypothetical protein